MQKKSQWRLLVGLTAMLAAAQGITRSAAADDTVYAPPKEWKGDASDATKNNPVQANGKPLWRFLQIWPEDLTDAENFIPLVWGNDQWVAKEHTFGGQPALTVDRATITLNSRGSWGGAGDTAGSKWAAFSFVAPKSGTFKVEGKVSADIWNGDGPVELRIILIKGKDKDIKSVTAISLTKGGDPTPFDNVQVVMDPGDELLFVGKVPQFYNAATIKVARFKISLVAP